MAKPKSYTFDEKGFLRIRETVHRVLGAPKTGSQQRRQPPVVGGGSCEDRNERWAVYLTGSISSGNLTLVTTVNGATENVTFAYNASISTVETAFEGHSEIGSGNVVVTGGSLPTTNIQVEFINDLAAKLVPVAMANISGLSGTAVGCIVVRLERGMPGDAS